MKVREYFKKKAEAYDLVEHQTYWNLSDELLWDALNSLVLSQLNPAFVFLDAGGGTGRWSIKVLENYLYASGYIYDFSPEMLEQARKKINQSGLEGKITLIEGDLELVTELEDNYFDVTFNFHNVLGFVKSPRSVLESLKRITKPGGYVVSVVPNLYHNIFFNITQNRLEAAEKAAQQRVGSFTPDMPDIHLFTPSTITEIYRQINLVQVSVIGFPITIYPEKEETQISGSSKSVKDMLEFQDQFDRIFQLERSIIYNEEAASRGNNLFAVGVK